MIKKNSRNENRIIRHKRLRKKIIGTEKLPRMCVFRSNLDIYVQVIDDEKKKTLVSSSSKELKLANGSNIEAAKAVGKDIASKCKKAKINKVVFDRGGYLYHGRVSALADSAREAGLEI